MLNIVIPMAGRGSRFAAAGYADPKPLVPVHGVPMIKRVIDNVRPSQPHRFVFVCQREHVRDYALAQKFDAWAPGHELVQLDGPTEGAACSVLAARRFFDGDDPLMIANSDQVVDFPIDRYLACLAAPGVDGLIMTMTASDDRWSFVRLNAELLVEFVAEKEPISNEATVGIYNVRHGRDFALAADRMLAARLRVRGEYYVAPAFNQLIELGQRIAVCNIGAEGVAMHGLGTPADLRRFLGRPSPLAPARVAG